jgi:hypothetical protein
LKPLIGAHIYIRIPNAILGAETPYEDIQNGAQTDFDGRQMDAIGGTLAVSVTPTF